MELFFAIFKSIGIILAGGIFTDFCSFLIDWAEEKYLKYKRKKGKKNNDTFNL